MSPDAAAWTAVLALMQGSVAAAVSFRFWFSGHRGYALVLGIALIVPVALGVITAVGADGANAFWYVAGSAAGLAFALPVLGITAGVAVVRSTRKRHG